MQLSIFDFLEKEEVPEVRIYAKLTKNKHGNAHFVFKFVCGSTMRAYSPFVFRKVDINGEPLDRNHHRKSMGSDINRMIKKVKGIEQGERAWRSKK